MTAKEILEQIESLKSKKSAAEGRVQLLTEQLSKYKTEHEKLVNKCVTDHGCQPKELKSLITQKQNDLVTKLEQIEEKLEELQGE